MTTIHGKDHVTRLHIRRPSLVGRKRPMLTLTIDWRPADGRATKALDGLADVEHALSALGDALLSRALDDGKATVVLTLKDRSAAPAAARKRKPKQ